MVKECSYADRMTMNMLIDHAVRVVKAETKLATFLKRYHTHFGNKDTLTRIMTITAHTKTALIITRLHSLKLSLRSSKAHCTHQNPSCTNKSKGALTKTILVVTAELTVFTNTHAATPLIETRTVLTSIKLHLLKLL